MPSEIFDYFEITNLVVEIRVVHVYLDNYPISSNSLEKFFYINGDQLGQQYKEYLSIDETALSNGELYTVLTNKEGKGQKGTLIAMIEGTVAESVIATINRIPEKARELVEEVTLDMAGSMNKIAKRCFPGALLVIDRYPDIKKAYSLTHSLRMIFSHTKTKGVAYTKPARWFNDVTESEFKSFNTISATVYAHYPNILNFFDNRSTNASAESFNAIIKAFRATQRGVTDIPFFLFRLSNIYA